MSEAHVSVGIGTSDLECTGWQKAEFKYLWAEGIVWSPGGAMRKIITLIRVHELVIRAHGLLNRAHGLLNRAHGLGLL